MANPASSPEFRQILRDLVDEGYEGGRSGQLLHEAWKRYKATYGSKRGLRRGKCKTCGKILAPGETKHHHGNPRGDFFLVIETNSEKVIKSFQREINAKKLLRRLSAKDGVGSYYIQRHSEWKKTNSNPRKKQPRRTCKACGALMGKGPVCLSCLNKNPKETIKQKIDRLEKLQKHYRNALWEAEKIANLTEARKIKHVLSELEPAIERLIEGRTLKNPIAIYNPPKGKLLPMAVKEIRYKRTGGEYGGELFKHRFKTNPKVFGLPDGSILIKSSERLWGTA